MHAMAALMKFESSALIHSAKGETLLFFTVYGFYSAFDPSTPGRAEVTGPGTCVAVMET